MRTKLLLFLLLSFSVVVNAQDSIFVKTGQIIPAIIIEKNNTEIKYKKFGQPESPAIYSVFVSDIKSIHYRDGIIADYTQAGQPGTETNPEKPIENAGSMRAVKFSIGGAAEYFARNTEDDLLVFWQDKLADPNAKVGGNPLSFPILLKMNMTLGNMQRHRIGDEVQIIITPADAIYASDDGTLSEIQLRNTYFNITMYYGRSLNHKKNLLAIIEPGWDIAFMSGNITLGNVAYNVFSTGMGFHIALGADWLISKRFTATLRGGYRLMTIKEWHEDKSSTTGYSRFYVDPGASEELLTVKWNGPYVNFGLHWSFYSKIKG